MSQRFSIKWDKKPEADDYPAALSYLSLIFEPAAAKQYVRLLERAPISHFHAKDIFRASQLSLLGLSNHFVEKYRGKIIDGKALAPILLVRDAANHKVIVADGYHRLCSVYTFDQEAQIPCKIV